MSDLLRAVSQHGYLLLFLIVFAEAVGLPAPAALALVAAGSAVPASPTATLAAQHLSAALDSVRKAADEITVEFGLRD